MLILQNYSYSIPAFFLTTKNACSTILFEGLDFFHTHQKSYVGSVPNEMINRSNSFRSKHPMCSFVAIGKHAEEIVSNHDHNSPAFEPVRKIVELQGKFIIEWSRALNGYDESTKETFEIIIYDTNTISTASGDNVIEFQYLET